MVNIWFTVAEWKILVSYFVDVGYVAGWKRDTKLMEVNLEIKIC